MMEVDPSLTCDMCRVSYSSEKELQEHNWSLMHHIKIEQSKKYSLELSCGDDSSEYPQHRSSKRTCGFRIPLCLTWSSEAKGALHSCNLCMETCGNLIEYGKHLNGDKHKMALSRLSKGGPDQILNSMGLMPHPRLTEPLNRQDVMNLKEDRGQHSEHFGSFIRHSRSHSQPMTSADGEFHAVVQVQQNEFKHPSDLKVRMARQKTWRREQDNYEFQNLSLRDDPGDIELNDRDEGQDIPDGGWRPVHEHGHRYQNGCEYQSIGGDNNGHQCFYNDNFGVNWNDNKFYSEYFEEHNSIDRWMESNNVETNRRKRRGSLVINKASERRGRNFHRGRHHMRAHSYDPQRNRSTGDRYSPESNSSTDSNGLKRRHEDCDVGTPEKSRKYKNRKRSPDFVYYGVGQNNRNFQVEKSNSHYHRSRSFSRHGTSSRNSSRGNLSQTEIFRPRSSSQNSSGRRVTWSDQQDVSSTTDIDLELQALDVPMIVRPEKHNANLVAAVPDSSTDLKKKKKKSKDGSKKNTSKFSNNTGKCGTSLMSDGACEGTIGEKDSAGTVLEKAEKLCKKLRNEREKIKQQKLMKEKQKKIEKNEELNVQIAELSKENKKRITGHLEATDVTVNNGDGHFEVSVSVNEPNRQRASEPTNISAPVPINIEPSSAAKETVKSSAVKSVLSPIVSGDPNIAARIAQTRADIDAIRAKIEGSVQADTSKVEKPSPSLSKASFCDKNKPDNQSLLKMVNAPRTTRERLHVAQLLRNHAKSQSKFSLPRFNLKMSDLVENKTELEDLSEFSIGALEPSVQLEIANLIEADIKPDVTELQVLLDAASSQNAVVDANILNDLGILQTPDQLSAPRQEDSIKNIFPETSTPNLLFSSDLQSRYATPEGNVSSISGVHGTNSPHKYKKPDVEVEDIPARDDRPSLSVEELVTEVNKAKEHLLNVRERERNNSITEQSQRVIDNVEKENFIDSSKMLTNKFVEGQLSKFASSLPISTSNVQGSAKMLTSLHKYHPNYSHRQIKVEKEDLNYDIQSISVQQQPKSYHDSGLALVTSTYLPVSSVHTSVHTSMALLDSSAHTSATLPVSSVHTTVHTSIALPVSSAHTSATLPVSSACSSVHTENSTLPVSSACSSVHTMNTTLPVSSVHRSVHTRALLSHTDELPVRDTESKVPDSAFNFSQNKTDSTVDRVNAILNAVPNMDNVLTDTQMSAARASPVSRDCQLAEQEKDKQLDSSVNSNSTSSVLDQVYSICVEEDKIRSEINSVDAKMEKLKSLISEAEKQIESFFERRIELINKESQYRSSRMKLLQENRSLQGSSGSQSGMLPGTTPALTETQIQDLNNPVLVRFLMSQRQSDLSSLGGYSNVESGSQPEDRQHSQRRGSITSFVSEQTEHGEPCVGTDVQKRDQNIFFTQSIDILSGSTDTLNSLQSQNSFGKQHRDSGTPIPTYDYRKNETQPKRQENTTKTSISLLKTPMEKFVTLEALMNGDTEIGQLISKSLESIQKGEVREDEKVVIKSPEIVGSAGGLHSITNRRESALSVGSDDMCISGSDTEKLKGKVSMKYMGALPGGTNYDSIMKQISSGSKNKPVMFTVVSSPEPPITGKSNKNLTENPSATSTVVNKPEVPPIVADFGMMCNKSPRSDTTSTVSLDLHDLESQSARSNFSLGEQIKRICDGQTNSEGKKTDRLTPRSESSGEKTLEDESNTVTNVTNAVLKECRVVLDRVDAKVISKKLAAEAALSVSETSSPVRKRLKSKKERDQKSRRKQKETFILQSDTNSEEDKGSQNSGLLKSSKSSSKSDEELVLTGSEDTRTSKENNQAQLTKRSLLDEVQLETETLSESGEEKLKRKDDSKRLTLQPKRLELFRENVKTKLGIDKNIAPTEYRGPSLSVTAIQLFKGEVYVCYNGSELRRFEFKTGKILRELDCSPYLVNCLHVTSVDEKKDVLFTAGACKKVIVFDPIVTVTFTSVAEGESSAYTCLDDNKTQNFNMITSLSFLERITCLHENWGRLFIGMSDGSVAVRSLKADKELNLFSCTSSAVHCLSTTSAGMTKMLCLGTGDTIIYVLDAITGLLITMLEGHTLPPLCIQVMAEKVISCSAAHKILVHDVSSGHLLKSVPIKRTLTHIWTDGTDIYAPGQDELLCVYDQEFKVSMVLTTNCSVTYGMIADKQLFLGYRNGMVEAIPVSSVANIRGEMQSVS